MSYFGEAIEGFILTISNTEQRGNKTDEFY